MKKLIFIVILAMATITTSCDQKKEPIPNKWEVTLVYNYEDQITFVCDSIQMISSEEAFVFIKNKKTKILAKEIRTKFNH